MAAIEINPGKQSLIELVSPTNPWEYRPSKFAYASNPKKGRDAVFRPTEYAVLGPLYNLDPDEALACGVITPKEYRLKVISRQLGALQKKLGRPTNGDCIRREELLIEQSKLIIETSERR